jgi:hypothetical protein
VSWIVTFVLKKGLLHHPHFGQNNFGISNLAGEHCKSLIKGDFCKSLVVVAGDGQFSEERSTITSSMHVI